MFSSLPLLERATMALDAAIEERDREEHIREGLPLYSGATVA